MVKGTIVCAKRPPTELLPGGDLKWNHSILSERTSDLQLWSMMTDLAPCQQVAAVILRLSGAAKDLARTLTPHEIMHGGVVGGNQLDPHLIW